MTKLRETETESAVLDCILSRLAMDPEKLDALQRKCLTLNGARERAARMRRIDPALHAEFSTDEALAGLLLNLARSGLGTYSNLLAASRPQ